MATTGTFRVQLVKSGIGFDQTQKDTLKGLGLRKRHKIVELKDTPSARGMVYKVRHLVKVIEAKDIKKPTAFKGAIVVPGPKVEPKAKKTAAKDSKSSKSKKVAKPAKK